MRPAIALRQVWEGKDFPAPRSILSRVTAEHAAALPPGFKYSLLTLVEHTDFWQRVWLNRLKGLKAESFTNDWRVPKPEEWPDVRERFLESFEEALRIAEAEPFVHRMKSDEAAAETLAQIAVHNAFHIGQFVLVKRAAKLSLSTNTAE